jgi:hypothetical protein
VPVNNTEGQGTGDGRIDRIASVPQGLQARLGGHRIHGRDEAFARRGWINGSGVEASDERQQQER